MSTPASQILIQGSWDSKKPVAPETAKHLFGYLRGHDSENVEVDLNDLVGRKFTVIGADDRRVYLEELPKEAGTLARKPRSKKA